MTFDNLIGRPTKKSRLKFLYLHVKIVPFVHWKVLKYDFDPVSDSFIFCRLPYSSIFGGVSAMTVEQFQSVNGFSNAFFGWGGEDDDMSNRFFLFTKNTRWVLFVQSKFILFWCLFRLKHVGYHISRYPTNIARYKMLYHRKEKANPKR